MNSLILSTEKTKEMVINYEVYRSKLMLQQISISNMDIEVVQSDRNLGVH